MKKVDAVTSGFIALSILTSSGIAFAAAHPSGTGQPNASCGSEGATMSPNGFGTQGFATAEAHYAGSDGTPSAAHAQSSHAVSQYDIACYQVTQNHR